MKNEKAWLYMNYDDDKMDKNGYFPKTSSHYVFTTSRHQKSEYGVL